MYGEVIYGKTESVPFEQSDTDLSSGKVDFDLRYHLTTTPAEIDDEGDRIEFVTYGVEIVKVNSRGNVIPGGEIEKDISENKAEAVTLLERLMKDKGTPEQLHDIAVDYVNEIRGLKKVS